MTACTMTEAPCPEPGAIKLHGGPFYVRRPRVCQCDWAKPMMIATLYTDRASVARTQMEFFGEALDAAKRPGGLMTM